MKSSSQIPELQALIAAVEKRFREQVRTTAGFERLAAALEYELRESLGASTLKRIWGYVPSVTTPRLSSLDILARYAGYADFKAFRKTLEGTDESAFIDGRTCLTSDDLEAGDQIVLGWAPNRRVTLRYQGEGLFEVTESAHSKLQPGDVFESSCFFKGWPLFIPGIRREGEMTPPYIAGKTHGLTLLEKL